MKIEKAKEGKGKRGKEREGERTPGRPFTRKCRRLREAKAIETGMVRSKNKGQAN